MLKKNFFTESNGRIGQITTIFFIQASSSIAFAVFFSGLSLFLTNKNLYSTVSATYITGLFLSLNYFLQLIGGLLANRITSYKTFYCLGTVLSGCGCFLLASGMNLFYGLSFFLMSSLVTNVCLNMFITKLFLDKQVIERRVAFTWSYMGSNLGFLFGYFITGWSTVLNSYTNLFITMGLFVLASLGLAIFFLKDDQQDPVISKNQLVNFRQIISTLFIMIFFVILITMLFRYHIFAQKYFTVFSCIILVGLGCWGFIKSKHNYRKKILQFFSFSLLAIVFWSIYMLTPTAIMQLIQKDTQMHIFGITLAPQWFVNIDSIVILILAPQFTLLLKRNKNISLTSTLNYFGVAFLFSAVSFVFLLLGLYFSYGLKIPMWALFGYLILMTIGEIFISPIGNSLIGELIPENMRSIMTGAWSMNIGIGGLLASVISNNFLLPYVNSKGLIGYNLTHLQNNIEVISSILILLTTSIFILCYYYGTKKTVKDALLTPNVLEIN